MSNDAFADFDAMDRREAEADDFARRVREAALELDDSALRKLELMRTEIRGYLTTCGPTARDFLVHLLVKYQP